MRLNTQQSLYDEVFELCDNILVVYILFFVGSLQHLEVPLRSVLVELLLIFVFESVASIFFTF